jgi:hypothetical protein
MKPDWLIRTGFNNRETFRLLRPISEGGTTNVESRAIARRSRQDQSSSSRIFALKWHKIPFPRRTRNRQHHATKKIIYTPATVLSQPARSQVGTAYVLTVQGVGCSKAS